MAGGYKMLRAMDGSFHFDMIENMGDAHEACQEMFRMIEHLAGGDEGKIEEALLAATNEARAEHGHAPLKQMPESSSDPDAVNCDVCGTPGFAGGRKFRCGTCATMYERAFDIGLQAALRVHLDNPDKAVKAAEAVAEAVVERRRGKVKGEG